MNLLLNLNNSANSLIELEKFIDNNFNKLYDYLSLMNHMELVSNREAFKSLSLKLNVFSELDFNKDVNIAFIDLLINACVRLGERFFFQLIYQLMTEKNIPINPIIDASSLYLTNVHTADDLLNRYDKIIEKLEFSFLNEEDGVGEESAVATIFNYYSLFIKDFMKFAQDKVSILKSKIWVTYNDKEIHFINNIIIEELYTIDLSLSSNPHLTLQKILDTFLSRNRTISDFDNSNFIIETNSNYTNSISTLDCNFSRLLSINKKIYYSIKSDEIFYSLKKGTAILKSEKQLFAYMYSYGDMHNEKLLSAFNHKIFPKSIFSKTVKGTSKNLFFWSIV